MSQKPHSREKRIVDKTVKAEKKTVERKTRTNDVGSVLKGIFGAFIKK